MAEPAGLPVSVFYLVCTVEVTAQKSTALKVKVSYQSFFFFFKLKTMARGECLTDCSFLAKGERVLFTVISLCQKRAKVEGGKKKRKKVFCLFIFGFFFF